MLIFIVFLFFSQKKILLKSKKHPCIWQKKRQKSVVEKNSHLENAIIFYDEFISIFKNLKPRIEKIEFPKLKKISKIGKLKFSRTQFWKISEFSDPKTAHLFVKNSLHM
nr:MAG TPA: hypothetical protein [Caudoviricetes sp.]